jgi:hypothetical protein
MSELFNRSVGTIVEVGTSMPYDLPHEQGSIRDGILSDATGAPIVARYVLAPCWVTVFGRVVGSDRRVEALVYSVPEGPVRVSRAPQPDPACKRS